MTQSIYIEAIKWIKEYLPHRQETIKIVCDYVNSLEQRNTELEQRVKELEKQQLTDLKHDMIQYQGYCNGWNSALSDNSVPPYKIYERIQQNKDTK